MSRFATSELATDPTVLATVTPHGHRPLKPLRSQMEGDKWAEVEDDVPKKSGPLVLATST